MGAAGLDHSLLQSVDPAAIAFLTGHSSGSLTLVGRFEGGTSGAWRVRHDQGVELVVKTFPVDATPRLQLISDRVRRLIAAGYPAPAHIVCPLEDAALVIQELIPGMPDPQINSALARQALALLDLQAGQGTSDPEAELGRAEFFERVRRSLLVGLDGYCEHASLEQHSDRTRTILARCRRIGHNLTEVELPADDLVHGDFHTANLMSDDDETVSGVVDWEGVSVGDRLFDLARLAFTAMRRPDGTALDLLWGRLLDPAVRIRAEAYVAHTAIIVIDWRLTRRSPGAADYAIRAAEAAFASFDQRQFVGFAVGE